MSRIAVCCLALLVTSCGGGAMAPSSLPQANIVSAGQITWGYRAGDGFSAFSGQVQNTGAGCAGPLVSGVATLMNGTTVVSSGNYLVATNTATRVMRPGEVDSYAGQFVPAVPPGTAVTNSTLTYNFTSVACP